MFVEFCVLFPFVILTLFGYEGGCLNVTEFEITPWGFGAGNDTCSCCLAILSGARCTV